MARPLAIAAVAAAFALVPPALPAQLTTPLDSATLAAFRWRSIGPAVMGGRVTDVEGDPRNPKIFYVATAGGGIWKTINAGTTFFPIWTNQQVVSMGDIAIAPSNPDIIYAGTGEDNPRNSISPGGGIFKSADGGKTWTPIGLEKTQTIARIVVDPTDPNVVYVAAMGHTWESNPERGLYKTTDGGKSWTRSKFIDDRTGFIDIAMDPADHNTLYAASWQRVRGPWFLNSGGPGSGLWKTTDGGATWTEIKGGGFPTTPKGRIGIAIAPSDPQVIYANVEADTLPNPPRRGERPDSSKHQKPLSGLYRSTDGGKTWTQMYRNEPDARPFYYSQVRVDPKNPNRVYWMSSVFRFSDDGGKTVRRGALGVHTDWHAMWIDPHDPAHYILGEDGGIAQTWDRGGTYDFINTFPIGQFYDVSYDMEKPYRVCGGLQDNGSWCGPSRTRNRLGITNGDWFNVGGGDGFYTANDPTDPNVIYSESQGGNISRLDLALGERVPIRRANRQRGMMFEDSLIVARGDTTKPETPEIARHLAAIHAAARADSARDLRFNWETPFFLSPHDPNTIYVGGNKVLESTDRGDHWVTISPDLSTRDSAKIEVSLKTTGGITRDATGAETYGTITTIAESPVRAGILWAGTDDGNVWLTRNDGGSWENLTGRFPGVPKHALVSRVEPSHFDSATVYVTFDDHQENDFRPYAYVSTDFGKTFRSIAGTLPQDGISYVHVIREDPHDRDLLFLGTDVAAYVSTDRGAHWQRFMTGLPAVPVHDLQIHPRDHELIAATHGRAIWITDIAPLEQMTDSVMRQTAYFFAPTTAYQYAPMYQQVWMANKVFAVENPPYGAALVYRLASGDAKRDTARIVVTDIRGDTVRSFTGPGGAGMHRVYWDLRANPAPLGPAALRDSVLRARREQARADSLKAAKKDTAGVVHPGSGDGHRAHAPGEINLRPAEAPPGSNGDAFEEMFGRGRRFGKAVDAGDYLVTITVGGHTMRQPVTVERIGAIAEGDF